LGQVFVSNLCAGIRPMLDAGLWMLDAIRNFSFFGLSRIRYPESSIAPRQAMRYLRRQLVGLRRSFANEGQRNDQHRVGRAKALNYMFPAFSNLGSFSGMGFREECL